jgi:hypothetical protein
VLKLPQGNWQSGVSYDNYAYLYDPATTAWQRMAQCPFPVGTGMACALREAEHEIVVSLPRGLCAYNYLTNAWRLIEGSWPLALTGPAAFDPTRDTFVMINTPSAPLAYYDFSLPNGGAPSSFIRPAMSLQGDTSFANFRGAKPIYHAGRDIFVIWAGGREVWLVDPTTSPWTSTVYITEIGNWPEYLDNNNLGPWGQFAYEPALDIFICQPAGIKARPWLLKLPAP